MPKYQSYEAGAQEAERQCDYWKLIRLRLGQHEQHVRSQGITGAGAFTSRNKLFEAIGRYVRAEIDRLSRDELRSRGSSNVVPSGSRDVASMGSSADGGTTPDRAV